jgi:anti-sigma B factor antagonist
LKTSCAILEYKDTTRIIEIVFPGKLSIRYLSFRINQRRPTLKTDIRTSGDIRILDCSGKITLGEGTMSIRNAVLDLLKEGARKIILNLADISYIDSSGVGELVSTYTTTVNQGGKLKLLKLSHKTRELLTITKLLTVFEVFDDEKAAVASFK